MTDPLAGSPWSSHSTIAGFAAGSPNPGLIEIARRQLPARPGHRALDIGCGAGRNAAPLAALGWDVLGVDLSRPMLEAASVRARGESLSGRLQLAMAPMDALPVQPGSCDLIVAHGIWNLARSGDEFRRAVAEAARAAAAGARLFVFTFSRSTLDAAAQPIANESFVFSGMWNDVQCFLTQAQLLDELAASGFVPDPMLPLQELNQRRPGALTAAGSPVIWQGLFRFAPILSPTSSPSE